MTGYEKFNRRAKRIKRIALEELPKKQRRLLLKKDACLEACIWLMKNQYRSLRKAYADCQSENWMGWLLNRLEIIDHSESGDADELRTEVPPSRVAAALRKLK